MGVIHWKRGEMYGCDPVEERALCTSDPMEVRGVVCE